MPWLDSLISIKSAGSIAGQFGVPASLLAPSEDRLASALAPDPTRSSGSGPSRLSPRRPIWGDGGGIGYCGVEVAWDVEAASEGTIERAASMMTVRVLVEVRPDWSVAM
jgi:hypothetical protein